MKKQGLRSIFRQLLNANSTYGVGQPGHTYNRMKTFASQKKLDNNKLFYNLLLLSLVEVLFFSYTHSFPCMGCNGLYATHVVVVAAGILKQKHLMSDQ